MDAKTLEALKTSIEKWGRNAVAEKPSDYLTGPDDCPLCRLYFYADTPCAGCPVYNKTGYDSCLATPYLSAHRAWMRWMDGAAAEEAHTAAREEVAFLKSLLPESE